MKQNIAFGFELGTGRAVLLPQGHMLVSGLTQQSGKSTVLRALAARSGSRVIAFETKPDTEDWLPHGRKIPVMIQGTLDELDLLELLQKQADFGMKSEFPTLIDMCAGAKDLYVVQERVNQRLNPPPPPPGEKPRKVHHAERNALKILDLLLRRIIEDLGKVETTDRLELRRGLNVMDLRALQEESQQLVVKSVCEWLYARASNVIVILDEAQMYIPGAARSAARHSVKKILAGKAGKKVFVWMASQAITSISADCLKNVSIHLLGKQTEKNEVQRALDLMSLPDNLKPKEHEIHQLQIGWFYVNAGTTVSKAYSWPAWAGAGIAKTAAITGQAVPGPKHS